MAEASPHKLPTASLRFPDGKTITVDVARTPKTREIGLMFRDSLPADYGMLFVFSNEGGMQFWMKNTWVDLDMLFIDGKKRVTVIHENVPRSSPDTPEPNIARRGGVGQYVLELPAGAASKYGLKAGRALFFDVAIPAE
ncbi:MAG: DUF192 domain-containing protein [Elusimicrobia bacterium]|nr:DUF192 domain-containing protein [Elusimicrobiota bacterium]